MRFGEAALNWYHSHSDLQEQHGLYGKNQFFSAYVGFDFNCEKHHVDGMWENEIHATAGVEYILPMFVKTEFRINSEGKARFHIGREDLALSKRLRFDGYWNTDNEYQLGIRYILTKRLQVSGNCFSHFGWGAA